MSYRYLTIFVENHVLRILNAINQPYYNKFKSFKGYVIKYNFKYNL